MRFTTRQSAFGVGIITMCLTGSVAAVAVADVPSSTSTGPTTAVSPYILPAAPGVHITSLLTVDDLPAENGVPMAGIPDGLGAYTEDGNLIALLNHEIAGNLGAVRAHGQTGAFVSRNVIDPSTGAVLATTDLIRSVRYWDYAGGTWASAPTGGFSAALNRFCSGALTAPGQLYDASSGTGYEGQVYFANEENVDTGRDFAVTMDGVATQLPRMGLYSYENTLVASGTGRTTVAIGTEDGPAGDRGQLRIYVGRKQAEGTPVERAGLTNGTLHVLDAADQTVSTDTGWRATYATRTAHPAVINEVDWNKSGPIPAGSTEQTVRTEVQNAEAAAKGLSLNRIEDGAFDPRNPNDFYFATTEGGDKTPAPGVGSPPRDGGGLWRLRFADVSDPTKGMTLELLLDGSESPYLNKPDNMGFDRHGHLMIQEDPGTNEHLSRIVAYRIDDGALGVVAQFDPERFLTSRPGPRHLTTNEESSGIIDVADTFGQKTFLFTAQVHTDVGLSNAARDVRHGQLLLLRIKSWGQVFNHRD